MHACLSRYIVLMTSPRIPFRRSILAVASLSSGLFERLLLKKHPRRIPNEEPPSSSPGFLVKEGLGFWVSGAHFLGNSQLKNPEHSILS